MIEYSFNQLKKNLKKDFSDFPTVNIAVLADSATQLFCQALKGLGYENQLNFDIHEADFDQMDRQILDPNSELYEKQYDFIILFESSQNLHNKYLKLVNKNNFADERLNIVRNWVETIQSKQNAKIIYVNLEEFNDSVYGNYAQKILSSYHLQIKKFNLQLSELSTQNADLFIVDLASLFSIYGEHFIRDEKILTNASTIFSIDFFPIFCDQILKIIIAIRGEFKKCLILDLDNTTWGGIIGDDGIENIQIGSLGIGKAFSSLQNWALSLKDRGIILCICSKNTESIAKEPFENHPDMVLRLDDIAVFVANWESKVDNIKHIQSVLNIGFDSMVFLDDNPFERNIVRENIKGITVPELPEDPVDYVPYLRRQNLFETASASGLDKDRTKQYQEEAKRTEFKTQFDSAHSFLESLEMASTVKPFDKFSIPRVAQLTQRSNQFNLRTKRYTEKDIKKFSESKNHETITFDLKDKFGEYGIISVIILEQKDNSWFIDTWIMSCRVLKRNVEEFVVNSIIQLAKQKGITTIVGEYIPTKKNVIVKDLYSNLGFGSEGKLWTLDVNKYSERTTFVNARNE